MKITKPTLIVNEAIARRNIQKMADKANRNSVELIPHFKTHQSKEVGEWFRQEGISKITVSSVSMAQYFADAGWKDITIAFPINILEQESIKRLASKVKLTLLIVDKDTLRQFKKWKYSVSFYIEIDTGYHRSGVEYNDVDYLGEFIDAIKNSSHQFKGFYCHAGNSYYARGKEEVRKLYYEMHDRLMWLSSEFAKYKPQIAIGDTPFCSILDGFEGISSIHPGNFVYYDVTQVEIGSCEIEDVAVLVRCPVVMKNETRTELVLYGGGVHFSKEQLEVDGRIMYGLVSAPDTKGHLKPVPNTYVRSVSQEHGVIATTKAFFETVKVGVLLSIIPVHSCMTVDCMQKAYTTDGNQLSIMRK